MTRNIVALFVTISGLECGRVVAIFGRSRMYERACWERVWAVTAEKSKSRVEKQ